MMEEQSDPATPPLADLRLTVRSDLVVMPHGSGDQAYYVVEDPLGGRFFRLGRIEYAFLSLLSGERTVREALDRLAMLHPQPSLSDADAATMCRWLIEMNLVYSPGAASGPSMARAAAQDERRRQRQRLNPLFCRIPLGDPGRALDRITPWLGCLLAPPAVVLWAAVVLAGGYAVASEWDRFVASSRGVFTPDNWIWITACWIVLKVIHELAHAVACHRQGGTVREAGIAIVFGAPLAYVDVTSCWRIRSAAARISVAAAGMYIELLVAGIAALLWSRTDAGWLNNLCYNTVLLASATTLLFNANPLMKFDGYYMLSDALGIPNLYANGSTEVRQWARQHLLGIPSATPEWPPRQRWIMRLYGWSSFVWRICVCVTLMATATVLFHGAGIVLAVCALVLWVGLPAARFLKLFVHADPRQRPRWARCAVVSAGVASLGIACWLVPWPGARAAPAVVDYAPRTSLRAASPGFVQQILVDGGQSVEKGQLLVVLQNLRLQHELEDLRLQIEQSEVRGRQHEQRGEYAQQQAEAEQRAALLVEQTEKQKMVEGLRVRAPRAGTVVGRSLQSLQGTYVREGDVLLSLGDETRKELRVSVGQGDIDSFGRHIGHSVCIDVPHRALWRGRLTEVTPRGLKQPPHPALLAINGGPLASKHSNSDTDADNGEHELLEPRFIATIRLAAAESSRLRAGQTARVGYRGYDESIAEHLYNTFRRWLRATVTP